MYVLMKLLRRLCVVVVCGCYDGMPEEEEEEEFT